MEEDDDDVKQITNARAVSGYIFEKLFICFKGSKMCF